MKICPICRSQFQTKAALAQHMASHQNRQGGRVQGKRRSGAGNFTMQCVGEEYLGTSNAGGWRISPGKSGLNRLDQYARLFQEYRIDKWVVKVKPVVGTTTAGSFVAGISYDYARTPTSFKDIAVLSPKITGTVWQGGTLVASAGRLMRQQWLLTDDRGVTDDEKVAGFVCLALDGAAATTTVAVWVDYSVTLQGPSSVARSAAEHIYTYDSRSRAWKEGETEITQFSAIDGPVVLDVEVKSGDPSGIIAMLGGVADGLQTLHTATVDGITYLHMVADRIRQVATVVATVSTVVRMARAPFRPAAFSWVSGAGGGNSPVKASSSRPAN